MGRPRAGSRCPVGLLRARSTDAPRHITIRPTLSTEGRRWAVLGELSTDGWEIGVHAAISAGQTASHLAAERRRLEGIVGRPVLGLRHHYWRLDWHDPTETFRRPAEAGYLYDTSMAGRDSIGFRAGTSLPYQPFDRLGRSAEVIEIPTTSMDGHVFEHKGRSLDEASAAVRSMAEVVRTAGGVLNLNCHQETYWNKYAHEGWRTVYEGAVADLAADSRAWITTPGELATWWQERAKHLN